MPIQVIKEAAVVIASTEVGGRGTTGLRFVTFAIRSFRFIYYDVRVVMRTLVFGARLEMWGDNLLYTCYCKYVCFFGPSKNNEKEGGIT